MVPTILSSASDTLAATGFTPQGFTPPQGSLQRFTPACRFTPALTLPTCRSSIPSWCMKRIGYLRVESVRCASSWSQRSLARIRTVRALNRLEKLKGAKSEEKSCSGYRCESKWPDPAGRCWRQRNDADDNLVGRDFKARVFRAFQRNLPLTRSSEWHEAQTVLTRFAATHRAPWKREPRHRAPGPDSRAQRTRGMRQASGTVLPWRQFYTKLATGGKPSNSASKRNGFDAVVVRARMSLKGFRQTESTPRRPAALSATLTYSRRSSICEVLLGRVD